MEFGLFGNPVFRQPLKPDYSFIRSSFLPISSFPRAILAALFHLLQTYTLLPTVFTTASLLVLCQKALDSLALDVGIKCSRWKAGPCRLSICDYPRKTCQCCNQ